MKLKNAIKAFVKAFKEPDKAADFLEVKQEKIQDTAHIRLLALLQKSGRLIDFFKEDLTTFSDAQIGAAVRKIHGDTSKSLEDLITIRPLFKEEEGAKVSIAKGYDPSEISLVGKIKGEPPYQGIVRHRGWKAHKISLPKQIGESKRDIIAPAEIEVQ